jgi:hypothetical protein
VGCYRWPDGSSYQGDVVNGLRHGFGTFVAAPPSKSVYEGQWEGGLRHGTVRGSWIVVRSLDQVLSVCIRTSPVAGHAVLQ